MRLSHELFESPATKLAEMIRQKKISSRELVGAHVRKLKQAQPVINAVIENFYEEALKKAAKVDEMLASKSKKKASGLPEFLGVPCTIKGNLAIKGKLWTGGSWYRKDHIASFTSESVERYMKAGLIPLCLTNVSEACMWMETDNVVHGLTRNPHNPLRTVGGSSGGEAAVIAAGGAPVGLGADIGGSIRIPAFFCGIAGHKPSPKVVPSHGHWPKPTGVFDSFNCIGPMSRCASDLYPLLNILAGAAKKKNWVDPKQVDLKKIKIYFYDDNGQVSPVAAVKDAVNKSVLKLESMGCQVEEWRHPGFAKSSFIWLALMSEGEGQKFIEVLGDGKQIPLWSEAVKFLLGKSRHTLPSLILAMLEKMDPKKSRFFQSMLVEGHKLKEDIKLKLDDNAVIISPVYTHPAPLHHWSKFKLFNWAYTAIYNVLEMPVTAVPTGIAKGGLPLGVQIASNDGNDHLTLAVALALEKRVSPIG